MSPGAETGLDRRLDLRGLPMDVLRLAGHMALVEKLEGVVEGRNT